MSEAPAAAVTPTTSPDWELDYYSRPILEPDGKKRWELLICSTPQVPTSGEESGPSFRWVMPCPASSVNSIWLKEALEQALLAAADQGFAPPRRLRCWRASMRTMVQRAAEGLGMELVPSRRTYALVSWLQEREREVYPQEPGYLAGPLAPPPLPIRPIAVPLPPDLPPQVPVPGIRLFSSARALALAGWLAGLEPVRLEISGQQLVLEAGLEDRWLLSDLPADEAGGAAAALTAARQQAGGLQFLAVQAREDDQRFEGFWLLRDLPDA